TFHGSTMVTTDGSSNATFTAVLLTGTTVGQVVTATATDPSGNTSEFSACRTVTTGAMTFTVTNTNSSGAVSLRQAISDANANTGTDTIAFQIAGAGAHTIQPTSPLTVINEGVIIDGTTQPGYSGTPLIEIDGTNATFTNGLNILAGGPTIRALAITRFQSHGINIDTANG